METIPARQDVRIEPAAPEQQAQALWLVLSEHPEAGRALLVAEQMNAAGRGDVSLAGLFTARRGGTLVGAAWGYTAAGGVGVVWPPQLVAGEPEATADALLARLGEFLARTSIPLAQALLAGADSEAAARLERGGFKRAANLLYLSCLLDTVSAEPPASPLEFISFSESEQPRLEAIIEQTYVATLDCPALDGTRTTADVIAGYRRSGEFRAERWSLVAHAGRDIGCLLLTAYPPGAHWELVYFGLTPVARGQGFGQGLIRRAQWQAQRGGGTLLVAAVDEQNRPALLAYEAAGFSTWDRRAVYIKTFAPPAPQER